VPQDYNASSAVLCLFIHSIYVIPFLYIRSLSVMLSRISFHVLYDSRRFQTIGSKDLTCEDWMVNTRTNADLLAVVQNALQTLLPQIRAEIREEFRTSFGPLDSGGNPPPITIHTWLERFNKQKPPAGTEEEQAKKFQWGLCRSTLNHLMCMAFTDVA
nr:hypothetical protein [Tanacetum cinerariifolium]